MIDKITMLGDFYALDMWNPPHEILSDIEKFEDSWNEVADMLKIEREPRLATNRSNVDYKKFADRKNLTEEFITWHKQYNNYDFKIYEEFCT